ncbi:MAG: AMP-binding protein [Candidatus Latescibacteria bacterium]|nr:AMP-binding protein [Candidatus Latescibacterota bacterium]
MEQDRTFFVSENSSDGFRIDKIPQDIESYRKLYNKSLENRGEFWKNQAESVTWDKAFTVVVNENFDNGDISWFSDGKLNACVNALDVRAAEGKNEKIALTFFSKDGTSKSYSIHEILVEVKALVAALKTNRLKSGERLALYLPDSPESIFFMLACARAGIIYVPIPYHYTAEMVNDIIDDCKADMLVVSGDIDSESYHSRVCSVIAVQDGMSIVATGENAIKGTISYSNLLSSGNISGENYDSFDAEHPLFILYANSATGIPRGSVFATGGFLVQSASSFELLFKSVNEKTNRESLVCCTNLASAAGQSYGLWGSFIKGCSVIITADGENPSVEYLRLILRQEPNPRLLIPPRVLAVLKRELDGKPLMEGAAFPFIACCGDVLSPRLVKFAGEALATGPEKVLNMWIQSESGIALINTYANDKLNRPGALGLPFFGIEPKIVNHLGQRCRPNESGQLVFTSSWPGMIRTIWGQTERFLELYLQRIKGYFNTNDGVRVDNDGFYWFMGRLDDVIKVRGQSLATSEIEAVLMSHPMIAESAVVSIGGEEGEEIVAYLVTEEAVQSEYDSVETELNDYIIQRVGEFAVPTRYIVTGELPRTRTGKVVRRLLRRIASGDMGSDEDLSHVANPEVVKKLIKR